MNDIADIHSIKNLSMKYFDGTITGAEEGILMEFISGSDSNMTLFRTWEEEWLRSSQVSAKTRDAWASLRQRLSFGTRGSSSVGWNWKRVLVPAVVVLGVVLFAMSALLMRPHPVEYYVCRVPYGSKSQIELPDGSVVLLNSGSKLRYSTAFNEDDRQVDLQGEAYFQVTKRGGRKFVVHTSGYDVVVKGTKFNVSAYADDPCVTTSLYEGSVELVRGNRKMLMRPGESVSLNLKDEKVAKSPNAHSSPSWTEGRAEYENIALKDLVKILNRKFDVMIDVQNQELMNERFTVLLQNKERLSDVLEALQRVMPVEVEREGNKIVIR